jgi:hypothetical protein
LLVYGQVPPDAPNIQHTRKEKSILARPANNLARMVKNAQERSSDDEDAEGVLPQQAIRSRFLDKVLLATWTSFVWAGHGGMANLAVERYSTVWKLQPNFCCQEC